MESFGISLESVQSFDPNCPVNRFDPNGIMYVFNKPLTKVSDLLCYNPFFVKPKFRDLILAIITPVHPWSYWYFIEDNLKRYEDVWAIVTSPERVSSLIENLDSYIENDHPSCNRNDEDYDTIVDYVVCDPYCASVRAEEHTHSGELGYTSYIQSSMYSRMRQVIQRLDGCSTKEFALRHHGNDKAARNAIAEMKQVENEVLFTVKSLFGACRVPQYITQGEYKEFYEWNSKKNSVITRGSKFPDFALKRQHYSMCAIFSRDEKMVGRIYSFSDKTIDFIESGQHEHKYDLEKELRDYERISEASTLKMKWKIAYGVDFDNRFIDDYTSNFLDFVKKEKKKPERKRKRNDEEHPPILSCCKKNWTNFLNGSVNEV